MATHIGIGFSQNPMAANAAWDAAIQAKKQTQQSKINIALLFNSLHYAPNEVLQSVNKALNNPIIVGGTTLGMLLWDSLQTRGVMVIAICSDDIFFGSGAALQLNNKDLRENGVSLAKNALADYETSQRRQGFLCLCDGLLPGNSGLLKGIKEVLGTLFPIIGGGLTDDLRQKKTYQYHNLNVFSSSAVGLILGGNINLINASRHGWKPLGKPRTIDNAQGHIIKTINGEKAYHIYENFFLEEAEKFKTDTLNKLISLYPLGIYSEETNSYFLRNALDILPDGSIVCQDEIPTGSRVHVMMGSKTSCRQAALDAALNIRRNLAGRIPHLILVFISFAHYRMLGRSAFKEIQIIKETIGYKVPLAGIYTYGEFAPFELSDNIKKCYLQNESITLIAIG